MAPSMIAVLASTVAQCPAGSAGSSQRKSDEVLSMFTKAHRGAMSFSFGNAAAMSFNEAGEGENRQFAASDDIFCIFTGSLYNLSSLRATYGVARTHLSEAGLVIEMYKALRDRAPFPLTQAVAEFRGYFSFVLYDSRDRNVLIALDAQGKYPLYWGTCQDGSVALSDDVDILRHGCSTSFAPFPAGCFFSSASGLKSFEHPSCALRAVPHFDAMIGSFCGSGFEVDEHTQLEQQYAPVGSYHELPAL